MKVCKVVINSISHDARVLKQAEAVREQGFDVTVLGIQDANIDVPVQILDNGVVLRRAAWQSEAARPWLISYIAQTLAIAVTLTAAFIFVGLVWHNYPMLRGIITIERLIVAIGLLLFLYFGQAVWRRYSTRAKAYLNLRRRENTDLLKYEKELAACQRLTPPNAAVTSGDSAGITTLKRPSPQERRPSLPFFDRVFSRITPRPLMGGFKAKLFSPTSIKKWKTVYARERQIRKLLQAEAPDIVHAHDLNALPVAAKYAKACGALLVFDAHEVYDHLAQSEDEMAELNSRILKKYSPAVDRFITINASIAQYYRNNYQDLPSAVVIKNAAIPADPIAYDGRLHDAAGLPGDTRIVIYQGGFASKRGLIQLLMAAEYLDQGWSLVYMGWGNLEEQLREVADALILKNPAMREKIRLVPKVKQDELPFWTAGATLGAIPYENTGLNHWFCNPNKLWEYPNAGVPILASPFPEMSAIINEYQLGWYLPDPLNPKLIADVINNLTDSDLRAASRRCREFIQKDNWNVYSRRLKDMYAALQ